MRIDAVSGGVSPDPRIYILLKVTTADGGGHKSRFRRYYESVRRQMQMRDLIRGHLHHTYAFIPSFSLLHPSSSFAFLHCPPTFPTMEENDVVYNDVVTEYLPSILIYSDGSATKIETTPSLSFFSHSKGRREKKLGERERGVKTIKTIIDRFEQVDF